jgi:hypothetical protein
MRKLQPQSLWVLSRSIAAVHDLAVSFAAFLFALVLRLDSGSFIQHEFECFAAAALFGVTVGAVGFVLGMNRASPTLL